MAAFVWDYYSGSSYLDYKSQYKKYLQQQNFTNELKNTFIGGFRNNQKFVASKLEDINRTISDSSDDIRRSINQSSEIICRSLELGFRDINDSLIGISDSVDDLSYLVGHGFQLLLEQQKITNKYLGNIQNLLKIPDSQKQRAYHIEEGIKYLANAIAQSPESEFYNYSFDEFKKALVSESKDYFSLFHVGLIQLSSVQHLDAEQAEQNFKASAKFALAEAFVGGTNVSNNLVNSKQSFIDYAAQSYLYQAEACYLQRKFDEAAKLAEEAWKIIPTLLRAGFMQSKYLAANNQVTKACDVLKKVIQTERYYSIEVLSEKDLISKPEIKTLLSEIADEAYSEAKKQYDFCNQNITVDSYANRYLHDIFKLLNSHSFLHSKQAIDLLQLKKNWSVKNVSNENSKKNSFTNFDFSGNVVDFIQLEAKYKSTAHGIEINQKKGSLNSEIETLKKENTDLQTQINTGNSKLISGWTVTVIGGLIWYLTYRNVYIDHTIELWARQQSKATNSFTILAMLFVIYIIGTYLAIRLVLTLTKSINIPVANNKHITKINTNVQRITEIEKELQNLN